MLWFGLRRRLARLARFVKQLDDRTRVVETRQVELERIRADLAGMIASAENATDKLNRVVERRRKQMYDAGDDEMCEHGVSMDDDCEDCELADMMEQRRGGNDGRSQSPTPDAVPRVPPPLQ